MRIAYYAGASTAAAAACLLKAFHQRPNFYSAAVYLSQSNACLLILTNLCLVLACAFMYGLQRLLYGPLRPIEIEQLSEKAWYAVLDTLLAMPSFREDVGGGLLTMFVLLLAGKLWGWIGEGRVDVLEQQPPANPRLFHARLSTSLLLSVIFDIYMLDYCVESVLADPRPGMMVIFMFEFAVLSIFSTFTLCRYGLTVTETLIVKEQTKQAVETRKSEIRAERIAAREGATAAGEQSSAPATDDDAIEVDEQEVDVPGWEEKRRYLFVLEVITDFIKLLIYIFFFTVSITFNALPMHIMRDVYMTFASFTKRVTDYVAYRKATSDMNARYPDATTEEIRGDSCIVCRETMVAWETAPVDGQPQQQGEEGDAAAAAAATPTTRRRDEGLRAKKLPCGHILHLRCLKAWLERQQVCPTCRRPVVAPNVSDSSSTAQQNAAGGQAAPGAHPPARPNRARIFNLGPIRVGLLNAPNNQLQNIVDQLRNAEAGNGNAPAADDQQGGGQQGAQATHSTGSGATLPSTRPTTSSRQSYSRRSRSRASVPLQIQLMQMEQRLLEEAHNLRVEQQQLVVLRNMEAELARLRTQHIPSQAPVGTQRQQQAHPLGAMPLPANIPQVPFAVQPVGEMMRATPTSAIGSGHVSLPDGLVLPEGWTLLPLHPMGGNPQAFSPAARAPQSQTIATAASQGPVLSSMPQAQSATQTDPALGVNEHVPAQTGLPSQTTLSQHGPTDENGSPLFVPTAGNDKTRPLPGNEDEDSSDESDHEAPVTDKAPWDINSGWGFDDTKKPNGSSVASAAATNGDTSESQQQQQRYSGKGKGKAVQMEDVSDDDEDS